MNIKFSKYQGAGNDFVLIDDRESKLKNLENKLIAKLCDRRFDIGADGLMLLTHHDDYDFEMIYYNADGKIDNLNVYDLMMHLAKVGAGLAEK